MDEPEIRYTRTEDGVDIAYWMIGEGPPLIVLAGLKREVASLARNQAFLQQQEKRRLGEAPEAAAEGVRFSPKWLTAHRKRVGLSARDYGLLVGVSGQTIYSWESGKSKPRATALAGWANMRSIGKREASRRLELLEG